MEDADNDLMIVEPSSSSKSTENKFQPFGSRTPHDSSLLRYCQYQELLEKANDDNVIDCTEEEELVAVPQSVAAPATMPAAGEETLPRTQTLKDRFQIYKDNFISKFLPKNAERCEKLTPAILRRCRYILQGPANEVLSTKFNLNITRSQLSCLISGHWLNDQVINIFMGLVRERGQLNSRLPRTHAMSSFFATRLLNGGFAAVRRWTRTVDLFKMDLILVPFNEKSLHWCLAIIDMRTQRISYYNSLNGGNLPFLQALAIYLASESMDKLKVPFNSSSWRLVNVAGLPKQSNGQDCGVFTCMYAEHVARGQPINFTQRDMLYFRHKMLLEICDGKLWQ
ncbi:sentrin-specific protease 1-like [Scaptodrosophila lebanonensis]|uniref:Sentrin-specific protease 1-like n=1 Tax=Drosophila lebanonensis TaxID=7225 RepID=A0A6J2UD14_DROLE|nr:sentrin-specific protease 1-like [Scaptodrosophila lebanonensis]XP_030386027.1 sentrin-specific protease 1-like [Scaptodrosophila lebanonensis]